MRKYYLDNIRWITVVIVVLYHVIYMYNAEGIPGVCGKITDLEVQYFDVFQYIVYPWFMMLLFMVSGISSRLYLDNHSHREFISSRTTKLLVPSTIGLVAFQFLQGYVNVALGDAVLKDPGIPLIAKVLICIASGVGVLWYIQLLWLFSMLLVLVRRIDRDRLWNVCGRVRIPVLAALVLPTYGAAQIFNTPIVCVYRFGLYFFVFLLGYFVLSHEEVIEVLKKWFPLLAVTSGVLGAAFCARYFGEVYADNPVYRSVLFVTYGYFACLAIFSFGLYVFHYLGISSVALFVARRGILPAPAVYLLSLIAGFAGAYLLNGIISRIPGYRWAVLGIKEEKKNVQG